jgi:hypothetical protein
MPHVCTRYVSTSFRAGVQKKSLFPLQVPNIPFLSCVSAAVQPQRTAEYPEFCEASVFRLGWVWQRGTRNHVIFIRVGVLPGTPRVPLAVAATLVISDLRD